MNIDPSILIWTVINFTVLMFLLNTFLFKPMLGFMHEREKKIGEGKAAEERAKAAAKDNEQKLGDELENRRREARERVEAVDAEAKKNYKKLIDASDLEIEERREVSLKKLDEDEKRLSSEMSAYIPAFVELLSKRFTAAIREDDNE